MVFRITFDESDNAVEAEPYPELHMSPDFTHLHKRMSQGIAGAFYVEAMDEIDAIGKANRIKKNEA